jgi:hypothetical protein
MDIIVDRQEARAVVDRGAQKTTVENPGTRKKHALSTSVNANRKTNEESIFGTL